MIFLNASESSLNVTLTTYMSGEKAETSPLKSNKLLSLNSANFIPFNETQHGPGYLSQVKNAAQN
jgi:hypothetical protein